MLKAVGLNPKKTLIPRATDASCRLTGFTFAGRGRSMSDQNPSVRDLTPEDVARGLDQGRMVLVDVREPNETALERFPGAVLVPLSAFDPAAIPEPEGREVVFACRSGRRSVTASLAAQEQGFAYGAHLAGGILAWKAAGLPTET